MKKTVYLTAIAVTVLIVDRLTKLVSTTAFLDGADGIQGRIGSITLAITNMPHQNTMSPSTVLLGAGVVLALFCGMIGIGYTMQSCKPLVMPLALVVFGASSNMADILLMDSVPNPLMVSSNAGWVAFNVADVNFLIGALLFALVIMITNNWRETIAHATHPARG